MKEIKINNRKIGNNHPAFIIGELSCNHIGSLEVAKKTILAMAESGADAIKLQTDTLLDGTGSTIECDNDYFLIKDDTIWDGRALYDLYMETYTPLEWHEPLKKICEDLGVIFLSTPYSFEAADFLENLEVPIYKIASMEMMDLPLVKHIAKKKKPIIMSRGMSEYNEIKKAIDVCKAVGNEDIIILHCVSEYPLSYENANVLAVQSIREEFNVISGISDHSPGAIIPAASIAHGAKVIEKHVILHKKLGGPDSQFSLSIEEFDEMVKTIRNTEKALGSGSFRLPDPIKKQNYAKRSLFAVVNINKGEQFSNMNVRSIRPGFGIDPNLYQEVIGKKASRDIFKGEPLKWDMIEK